MQRRIIITAAASTLALVGCLGNPAIVGVGDEGDDVGGEGGSGDDDAQESNGDSATAGEDGNADSDDDSVDGGEDTGPAPSCVGIDAFGETPSATLTGTQYDGSVRDLTGAAGPFAEFANDDARVGAFGLGMEVEDAAALAPVVAEAVDLAVLLPCDPQITDETEQQGCFDAFVPGFARLAWRRPVGPEDLDEQVAAFSGAEDFATRMRAVIASVLADEDFIVLSRAGTPTEGDPELVVLDAHALATRLAMFLWNSGPDAELLDLADTGDLLDPEVLHAQAQRLLADVRAARMVDDFHAQWLDLRHLPLVEKDEELFPEFDEALARDMLRGTLAFARSVVLDGSGELRDLFTQPTSFANATLAAIYGDDIVGPVPSGALFEAVMLDPARRGGLLGEPSFAARHSLHNQIGFTKRGMQVLEGLLCTPLPPSPPGVELDPVPPPSDVPHKEAWEAIMGDAVCQACHKLPDPISFAFDNYDAIGRWTDTIDGFPVDPSGNLLGTPFANRAEMIELVLANEAFYPCIVDQYARYALDRPLSPDDECTRDALVQALAESDGNVRALALAMADSDAFRVARLD